MEGRAGRPMKGVWGGSEGKEGGREGRKEGGRGEWVEGGGIERERMMEGSSGRKEEREWKGGREVGGYRREGGGREWEKGRGGKGGGGW